MDFAQLVKAVCKDVPEKWGDSNDNSKKEEKHSSKECDLPKPPKVKFMTKNGIKKYVKYPKCSTCSSTWHNEEKCNYTWFKHTYDENEKIWVMDEPKVIQKSKYCRYCRKREHRIEECPVLHNTICLGCSIPQTHTLYQCPFKKYK